MLALKVLVAVIAFAPIASAFFPWFPAYRCIQDHTCIDEKRNVGPDVAAGLSFKIVQRLPKVELPPELHIRHVVDRLMQKYSRTTKAQPELENQDTIVKRTNTYAVVSAPAPTQTNSAPIDQDGTDYSYFTQVLFGSSSKPLYMLLDTGAGTTWVMGSSCTSDPCKSHNSFGPADSTTFQPLSEAFNISYGSGSVSGMLATDTLAIAGFQLSMAIGIANLTSNDFNAFPIDGILGLSPSKGPTLNFVETLTAAKVLKSNIFGVSINRASDGPNTGEINFGAPDTSKFLGDLNYVPLDTSVHSSNWAIPMDSLGLGPSQAAGVTGRVAYLDTGTTYIFGPPADVAALHALVPGATTKDNVTYSVPCTTTTNATFTFKGLAYSVSSKDWVGPNVSGSCSSNIYGHAVVEGSWLLGDTFLKGVYAVFDIDQSRIGFAPKIPAPVISSTSSTIAPTASAEPLSGSSPATPGLNGHETYVAGTAAAETSTRPSATPTQKSAAPKLKASLLTTILGTIALFTLIP